MKEKTMKKLTLFITIFLAVTSLWVSVSQAGEIDVTPFLKKLKNEKSPDKIRLLKWQRELIEMEFSLTREKALNALGKEYPDLSMDKLSSFLDDPAASWINLDGQKRYFAEIVNNIMYRNPGIAWEKTKGLKPFVGALWDQVFPTSGSGYPAKAGQPYITPVDFQGSVAINIPRNKLPASGNVEFWIPLPLATASQKWPRVVSLSPEKYLTTVPRLDGNISFAHFSFPMEELESDLKINVEFSFSHYKQRFLVDPAKVLPYEKDSAEYKEFTRSYANTSITSDIRKTAKRIVGKETNAYLAAQKIYRYIVNTIPYSQAPHATLQILGIPESVYVHEHGHGDCGAQSMYFSALCRALGIPARSTGGFQVVPGWAGPHFWAEFYLEGYGWIPVDPTVAETADWTGEITEQERRAFKDYFFGNLDPYRFVIQKDVDMPLHPSPSESMFHDGWPTFFIQRPVITCPDCTENPYLMLYEYSKITYFPVDQ